MRLIVLAALITATTTAGCLADAQETRNVWTVSGAFTGNATQENTTSLDAEVEALNGSLAIMESHPMQYAADLPDEGACAQARALLLDKTYVASVGECHARTVSVDPDAPTSSG